MDVNDLSIDEINQVIAETKQSDKEKIGTSADSSSASTNQTLCICVDHVSDYNAAHQAAPTPHLSVLVFLITALVTAALPIYLFTSPMFNLDLAQVSVAGLPKHCC